MSYTAIKAFTYAGRAYAYGDDWAPSGHKNDTALIRARFVIDREVDPKVAQATAGQRQPRRKAGA
jgi:hypothetical protein